MADLERCRVLVLCYPDRTLTRTHRGPTTTQLAHHSQRPDRIMFILQAYGSLSCAALDHLDFESVVQNERAVYQSLPTTYCRAIGMCVYVEIDRSYLPCMVMSPASKSDPDCCSILVIHYSVSSTRLILLHRRKSESISSPPVTSHRQHRQSLWQ